MIWLLGWVEALALVVAAMCFLLVCYLAEFLLRDRRPRREVDSGGR